MNTKLTAKEEEIYKYRLKGLSYLEIANEMFIEKTTVITHIMNVYMKKLVGTRAELMAQRIEELEKEVKELKRTKCNTMAK